MKQQHYLAEIEGLIRTMYVLSWPMDTLIHNKEQMVTVDLRDVCYHHIMGAYT